MEDKWISVNRKKKPKPEKKVLVYAPNCSIIGSILIGEYFEPAKGFEESWTVYDFTESKLSEKVTHWQPLPNPPKE